MTTYEARHHRQTIDFVDAPNHAAAVALFETAHPDLAGECDIIPLIWEGDVDSDGISCIWRNRYRCDECNEEWADTWSCQCDDECPSCGNDFSPYQSDDLTETR